MKKKRQQKKFLKKQATAAAAPYTYNMQSPACVLLWLMDRYFELCWLMMFYDDGHIDNVTMPCYTIHALSLPYTLYLYGVFDTARNKLIEIALCVCYNALYGHFFLSFFSVVLCCKFQRNRRNKNYWKKPKRRLIAFGS